METALERLGVLCKRQLMYKLYKRLLRNRVLKGAVYKEEKYIIQTRGGKDGYRSLLGGVINK